MNSTKIRLFVVLALAAAFIDASAGCRKARSSLATKAEKVTLIWTCPPNQVLFEHGSLFHCSDKCATCPNGFCYNGVCHCFPGTSQDSKGDCGQICMDCENGWCSSKWNCECNEGFTRTEGRCEANGVGKSESPIEPKLEPQLPSCPIDYIWDSKVKECVPYEDADFAQINPRMDNS